MATYNEKLSALSVILSKTEKEIEQLKSEKIVFSDDDKNSLVENLKANYSTAFIVKNLLRQNLPFYISLLLSEEERAKENQNVYRLLFGEQNPNKTAVRVKAFTPDLIAFCEVLGLEINKELNLVFCTDNRSTNATLRQKVVDFGLMVKDKVNYKDPIFQSLVKFLDDLRNDLNGEIGQREKGKGKKQDQILRELKYIDDNFKTQWNEEEQASIFKSVDALLKSLKKQNKA